MEEENTVENPSFPLLQPQKPNTHLNGGGGVGDAHSATKVVVFSTLVAVAGSYGFGSAAGYTSPAAAGIMSDLGFSTAQFSLFGSLLTFGAMLGSVMTGKVADIIGRRGTMAVAELFCILGWLAIVLSKGAFVLDLGRFSLGCGVGIISYVVPVYIAEITPMGIRGGYTTVHQFMICLGSAATYLIGTLVTWRVLAILGFIPCFVQLVGLFFIPESPRWLAKIGREKEFEAALQHLRGPNADTSQEADDIRDFTETLQKITGSNRFLELFQAKYANSLIVGLFLMILQQFGGSNGITFYASSIFEAADFSTTVGTIAMAIIQIPATTSGVLLMDKTGRKPLLMISATGTFLGCIIVGGAFLLQDLKEWTKVTPSLVLVGLLVYYAAYALGIGGIPWVIMSEIFPINVKGSAGSLVVLVNWSCSWVVSYSFSFLLEWSTVGTFGLFAVISVFTVIFVAKFVPETKGRSLEEIQISMNSPSVTR